jgi:DNA-binding HxlR family transcriptional regulator
MGAYGAFCPVAQALDLVGERWTLLVIRELLSGSRRFGEILNGLPHLSRSVLAARLDQLECNGLVRHVDAPGGKEYVPTPAAVALEPIVLGLGSWSRQWAHRAIRDDELDPTLLLWDMQRRIDAHKTPPRLVCVRIDFRDGKGYQRYWLKIEGAEGEVCVKHPGIEEALVVSTTLRALTEVWMGHRTFAAVQRAGELSIEGPAGLARAFPTWFRLNVFVQLDEEKRTRAAR